MAFVVTHGPKGILGCLISHVRPDRYCLLPFINGVCCKIRARGTPGCSPDWYFLRRFLRARQHDLKRAKDMYATSMRWRAEFGADTILDDFKFAERDAFISLYPQGYHKTDKLVHLLALRVNPSAAFLLL